MSKNPRTTKPTTIGSIPKPPSRLDTETKRYLETLAEAIEVRLGRRGDTRDRAVTLRELIDSGLAKELLDSPFDPNNPGGNITSPTNFQGDVPYLDTPPAPTGFNVASGYETIILSWDFPFYANHSATLIYRHATNSLGDAKLAGEISRASGRVFVDPVGENQSYYYWIAHQTTDGVIGPFNSSSGTLGTTAMSVDTLLTHLNASIPAVAFASGLSPVEVVNSLPNPTGYTGPTLVLLTTDGKLYRYVTGAWTAAVATVDLTGTISSLQIAANAVTNAKIAVNAITESVIAANAITTTKIADNAIESAKISAGAIIAGKIGAGAIVAADIQAGTITATEMAANSITSAKIASGAITTVKLDAGAVTANEIGANAITANKIDAGAIQAGAISAGAVNASNIISNNVIVGNHIQSNTITATEIAAGTITGTEIAGTTITGSNIVSDSITATEIKLDNATIEGNASGQISIKDLGVTNAKIGNAAVDTLQIAGNAATVPDGVSGAGGVTLGVNSSLTGSITGWTDISNGGSSFSYGSDPNGYPSKIMVHLTVQMFASSPTGNNFTSLGLYIFNGSGWLEEGVIGFGMINDQSHQMTTGHTFVPNIVSGSSIIVRVYARTFNSNSTVITGPANLQVIGCRR